jgi:predicted DNA binding protein
VIGDSSYGVLVVDATGAVVFSNGFLEAHLGFESEAVLDTEIGSLSRDDAVMERVRAAAQSGRTAEFVFRDAAGEPTQIAASCERTTVDGEEHYTLWCEQSLSGDFHATITTDDQPARSVKEVTDIGRALLDASDPETVASVALDGIGEVFDADVACIRLFDEEQNDLARVATTDGAAELLESRPAFDLNKSLAGRAFRRGEPVLDTPERVADDVTEQPNFHVPLDDVGTLTVFTADRSLTRADVEPVEYLASFVAARLEQLHAGADRPTDDASRRHPPLAEVASRVVAGETREVVLGRACEGLADTDRFASAWFVTTEVGGEWRAVAESAGANDTPPENVRQTSGTDDDPVHRAVSTGEVAVVQRRRTVEGGRSTDGEHVETSVVVPVAYADRTYGVLVVQADGELAISDGFREDLALFGEVVALASYAAESRKLLLSETVQQLEFEVTDRDCLAVGVSADVDAFCEVEHQTLTNDGDHLIFLRVEGAEAEPAVEATLSLDSVADCRVVEDETDSCLLEVVKTRSGAEAMMDVGATVREATGEDGVGTLVVETAMSSDVRDVVDAYTDLNPGSHLVAKREIDRPTMTADTLRESFEEQLTDRQQSVLTTAYYAGYFDWPRANTAEEIADSLDISPATLHQHLRGAEQKLLNLVCEDRSEGRNRLVADD